jgi:hypothetical protein
VGAPGWFCDVERGFQFCVMDPEGDYAELEKPEMRNGQIARGLGRESGSGKGSNRPMLYGGV